MKTGTINAWKLILRLSWARLGDETPKDVASLLPLWNKDRPTDNGYSDVIFSLNESKLGRKWLSWIAPTVLGKRPSTYK